MKIRAFAFSALFVLPLSAATPEQAALAVNALGLDLQRRMPKQGNLCLSPYSIQSALAMTYLGASGATQEEMARVLHFSADKQVLAESFAELKAAFEDAQKASVQAVASAKVSGGPSEPVTLRVANRLFGQKGYDFRRPFLTSVKAHFGAPMQVMNFIKGPDKARLAINDWVADQTKDRIRDLIPPMAVERDTRLVLVNALYFKAPWAYDFEEQATSPRPFHMAGGKATAMVPTMIGERYLRHHRGRGFQAVTLPYAGSGLHFLLMVPDSISGIASLEAKLTPEMLLTCAKAKVRNVLLYLPKFKITPPTMELGEMLQKMGMNTAFNNPPGSADFDAMAVKGPDGGLYISEVFHQTFLALDEKGAEAAAATASTLPPIVGIPPESPKPVIVKADRPFLFAIQHAQSGACLFLGRVSDPR